MKRKKLFIAVATALCAVLISSVFHHLHWQDLLLLSPLLGVIQYSGGTLINRTFTPSTRADWVNNITQALSDAGWTTISGTPGSGSDVTLETAAQSNGYKIRFRFVDPGSGNCAKVTMKHPTGLTAESQVIFCLPTAGSGLWRVIANKFQFFAFASGAVNAIVARSFCFGGTVWTPTWLTPTTAVGWMIGAGQTDTDANTRTSFRRSLRRVGTNPVFSAIYGSNLVEGTGSSVAGGMSIASWQGGSGGEVQGYRWEDDTLAVYEPLICWATGTTNTNESKVKGQLYDACVFNGITFTSEGTVSLDGRTWLIVTDSPLSSVAADAVLALAIT